MTTPANEYHPSDGATLLDLASTSTNNRVVVDGGTLCVTNASMTGTLDVRRGTNVINSGLLEADILLATNTLADEQLGEPHHKSIWRGRRIFLHQRHRPGQPQRCFRIRTS